MLQVQKDERSSPTQQERVRLPQTMGLQELVALGVGGTIGGAIFVLVGTAIDQAGPLGALCSFVLAFLVAIVIALPYTELACRFPLAGGGYAFVQALLGRHWGFLMGWAYAGAWLFIGSYVTLGFGGYLQQILSEAFPVAGKVPRIIDTLFLIIAIVIINLAGGHGFARLQKFIVLLAMLVLIGAGVAGIYCAIIGFHGATITRFSFVLPHGISGVFETTSLAFLALSGFDIVATTSEEVKKPKRTLPLAILSTLGIVLLLYLLVTVATAGALSDHQLHTKTPLSDAARQLFGEAGQQLVAIAAVLTTAATGNALLAATSRITFAMARDGLLPRLFARLHPSTEVPWIAIIANGVIFSLFALTASIDALATAGSFLYILQFVFPLIALVLVRSRSKTVPSFRTPVPRLILPLAFTGCLLLLWASGQKGIEASSYWLVAGLVIHMSFQGLVIYLRRRRYLKKGYTVTTEEIVMRKDQISRMLNDPQVHIEQLETLQTQVVELKQFRAIQAHIEEVEQHQLAQARIKELKQLRSTQARIEQLELLQAIQLRIEEFKQLCATQARTKELETLQTLQLKDLHKEIRDEISVGSRSHETEPVGLESDRGKQETMQ
jgi:APA family basic amino acid/polyamine antiporter